MPERFIALGTEDLREMLERAWNQAPEGANTLFQQLQAFAADANSAVEGAFFSSASNGHSASAFTPGADKPTSTEIQRGWNTLIKKFRETRQYLLNCCKYGLDAFTIKDNGEFPSPLPSVLPENERIIVDDDDRWEALVEFYNLEGTTSETVVGEAVNDTAIFLWMMDNLIPVRETRGDYSMGIVGRTGGFL